MHLASAAFCDVIGGGVGDEARAGPWLVQLLVTSLVAESFLRQEQASGLRRCL